MIYGTPNPLIIDKVVPKIHERWNYGKNLKFFDHSIPNPEIYNDL